MAIQRFEPPVAAPRHGWHALPTDTSHELAVMSSAPTQGMQVAAAMTISVTPVLSRGAMGIPNMLGATLTVTDNTTTSVSGDCDMPPGPVQPQAGACLILTLARSHRLRRRAVARWRAPRRVRPRLGTQGGDPQRPLGICNPLLDFQGWDRWQQGIGESARLAGGRQSALRDRSGDTGGAKVTDRRQRQPNCSSTLSSFPAVLIREWTRGMLRPGG